MKRTPWFFCKTPPVRPGWYEAQYDGESLVRRRYFDGNAWRFEPMGPLSHFGAEYWGDQWRGLTEPAK